MSQLKHKMIQTNSIKLLIQANYQNLRCQESDIFSDSNNLEIIRLIKQFDFHMRNSPAKRDTRRKRSSSTATLSLAQDTFLFKDSSEQLLVSKVCLFEKFITIEPEGLPDSKCKIQIDFDTIFSVIRENKNEEQEKTFSGVPFGIMFQKYQESIEILNYQQPSVIQKWRKLLANFLNQRNFHQVFKPIKKIGKGNFATVYLVTKHQDKNLYAVKAFSKQIQFADERGKESIENEIKIMRNLNHPNLMKLDGVYETQNSIYFVVEYLSGGLLYDKIKKRHSFTTDQVLEIMESLLKGISAMHEKRIMHRDLKPENILFREEGQYECVIADFGLATFADSQEYIYTRCGTPGYVAPEISNLKDKETHYDPICDIFSLGVIFHLLALGSSPFPGRQCDQVLKQNRECNINFSDEAYSKLHPTWLDLLQKMLEKDPQKRISAKDALRHEFFTESSVTILEELQTSKYEQCDSPLMITKNNNRKRNLKLRDDSCLKFKMKQNIPFCKDDQENIQKINSPLRKRISRPRIDKTSRTVTPSNFKQ